MTLRNFLPFVGLKVNGLPYGLLIHQLIMNNKTLEHSVHSGTNLWFDTPALRRDCEILENKV